MEKESWEQRWKSFIEDQEYLWECPEMRTFRKDFYKKAPGEWNKVRVKYEQLVEHFGGKLPESLQRAFTKNWKKDYVLENLQTHNSEDLIGKLKERFGDLIVDVIPGHSSEEKSILFVDVLGTKEQPKKDTIEKLKNSKELRDLLDFYGYVLTDARFGLEIEPRYPESADEFVYKQCKGQLYHLTDFDVAKSILQSGLRCKNSQRDPITGLTFKTRDYPERVYLFGIPGNLSQDQLREKLYSLGDQICFSSRIAVLRVNVQGLGINFYRDPAMEEDKVFTYTNIPADRITPFDHFTIS